MKLIPILSLTACVLASAGCSSTPPTKVDTGQIHAQTFSFVNRGTRPSPAYTDNRQPVHAMIQGSITKNLATRGVTRVDSGGDITVGYLVIIGNNVSTEMISDYFDYGGDAAALHDKAHDAYTSSKNPNYFEAGTLVIDIIDTHSYKLLKRGYATRQILKDISDDTRAVRIQEVVDEILNNARITP
jgi:hypothetical protein